MILPTRRPDLHLPSVRLRTAAFPTTLLVALALVTNGCGGGTSPASVPTPATTVRTVTVSPATASLAVGATTSLTAAALDQNGATLTGRSITWSSAAGSVATVSATGVVTAVTAGSATITATVSGVTGSATITVTSSPRDAFQTTVPTIDLNAILARPTESSVALSLWSATARTASVTLTPGNRVISQPLASATMATVDLTGLTPDQGYQFRVDAPGATSVSGSFRTARGPGTSYRVVLQADSHLDNNSDLSIYANTLANMTADAPDFLIDLGDTFMTDKYADYHSAAAQYYAQRYWFGLVGRTMPVYLVQGNHDGELAWLPTVQTWAASQRNTYFPPVNSNAFYSSALSPRNYYSWMWGDATYIVLDPFGATFTQPSKAADNWAWSLGKEQYDWLVSTLQKNSSKYTFVFLHNLVGGSTSEARGGVEASVNYEWGGLNADGTTGFATKRAGWAKPIHDLFVQYKVSAVFHGHDHLYVHQTRDGISYQEVPQPSFARENSTSSAVDYGYLSGTLLGSSGHLRITVTPTKATVEYIRSRLTAGNGDVMDRYELLPAIRP